MLKVLPARAQRKWEAWWNINHLRDFLNYWAQMVNRTMSLYNPAVESSEGNEEAITGK